MTTHTPPTSQGQQMKLILQMDTFRKGGGPVRSINCTPDGDVLVCAMSPLFKEEGCYPPDTIWLFESTIPVEKKGQVEECSIDILVDVYPDAPNSDYAVSTNILQFSRDARRFCIRMWNENLRVESVFQEAINIDYEIKDSKDGHVQLSPDGKYICRMDKKGTFLSVYDVQKLKTYDISNFSLKIATFTQQRWFSSSDRVLISSKCDGVGIFDIHTKSIKVWHSFLNKCTVHKIACCTNERRVVLHLISLDGQKVKSIEMWDIFENECIWKVTDTVYESHIGPKSYDMCYELDHMFFSPDGLRVITKFYDRALILDAYSGRIVGNSIEVEPDDDLAEYMTPTDFKFSPKGFYFLICCENLIRVYNYLDGTCALEYKYELEYSYILAYSFYPILHEDKLVVLFSAGEGDVFFTQWTDPTQLYIAPIEIKADGEIISGHSIVDMNKHMKTNTIKLVIDYVFGRGVHSRIM